MLQKFLVSVFSAIVISLILAIYSYTPQLERLSNSSYASFSGLVSLYLIYITPLLIIIGVPVSIIIEKINEIKLIRSTVDNYFYNIGLYTLAGGIVGNMLFLFISVNDMINYLPLIFFCLFSSIVFYHISLFIRKLRNPKY
ncbi:hypothetical protein [Cytobacillus sp. IB215316]|uniref:hypothetical protein n=1 Tax=Cytobacillus sp. IB215316 TaxID=3097354 RepID=UPI002A111D4E|nr:hypothetical protein [Cytobacillus sp. IB215316]MDX8362727.1 hypothetical protein [Cytobacillus sp. IB215316]